MTKKPFRSRTPWIMLSLLILAGYTQYQRQQPQALQGQEELYTLLEAEQVKRLAIKENSNTLYITLNEKGLQQRAHNTKAGPHYTLKVPKGYEEEYSAQRFKNEQYIPLNIDESTLLDRYGSMMLLFFFLLLLLLLLSGLSLPNNFMGLLGLGNTARTPWRTKSSKTITFQDIQGMAEAKEAMKPFVHYLKAPAAYRKIGATLPKGALLAGPPGTGKTHLIEALSGETGVPFIKTNGSSFDEIFVGMGALRIRKLHSDAEKEAAKHPSKSCIIFIDEIDSLCAKRASSPNHSNASDHVLNQFLASFDVERTHTIIVFGSTNRPEVLDPAILRPGRLGTKIYTNNPSRRERHATLTYYLGRMQTAPNISIAKLASNTTGFSYADLKELCNDAGLLAAGEGKEQINEKHLTEALNRVLVGAARKETILTSEEKKRVSYHEIGHAIVSYAMPTGKPLNRISIIPRSKSALGFAQYHPDEKHIHEKSYIENELCILVAGKAAEEIGLGESSTGAQNDLVRATRMAYSMVAIYGMSEKINMCYYDIRAFGASWEQTNRFSEKTAARIDEEATQIIQKAQRRARAILTKHKEVLIRIAEEIMQEEEISGERFCKMAGDRKHYLQPTPHQPRKSNTTQQQAPSTPNASPSTPPADGPAPTSPAQ